MENEDDLREKKCRRTYKTFSTLQHNGSHRYYGYGYKFGTGLSLSHGGQKRSKNNLSPALPNHFSSLFF